ncbi:MAG: hypothetical protein IJE81_03595 [Oscillospiraceae bacterium]|nr:hypothetical protein [Oscillospiraceae bacterium]
MPANYALHRFGAEALRTLPQAQQRPIQRFRRLYNGGLHGIDLFFYYQPMLRSAVRELYHTYGSMTGREFFTQACELQKQNPSEGGIACLYGLLGSYCLNTQLSPLFRDAMAQGISRTELEVELDRHLLCQDGKMPAHTQDISASLKLTRGECVTVAQFFPPATAANVYSAHSSLMFWTRRFASPKRRTAKLLQKAMKGGFAHQMMPDHANHRCMHLDDAMVACCSRALEVYPEMARQLTDYRETGSPLGELFDAAFH